MKWKFWKKSEEKDETTIRVTDATAIPASAHTREIYVNAQTSEKALELYEKLRDEKKE